MRSVAWTITEEILNPMVAATMLERIFIMKRLNPPRPWAADPFRSFTTERSHGRNWASYSGPRVSWMAPRTRWSVMSLFTATTASRCVRSFTTLVTCPVSTCSKSSTSGAAKFTRAWVCPFEVVALT